jgi:hypothetical protein
MNQEQLSRMSPRQKVLIVVSHLMEHPELRPEQTKDLFSKMDEYDAEATTIQESIKKAKRFINESNLELQQNIGAINAISELIVPLIPKENIDKWCLDFDFPNMPDLLNSLKMSEKPQGIDMAGATARSMPPVNVDKLNKPPVDATLKQ